MRALKKSKKTRRTARTGTAKITPASQPADLPADHGQEHDSRVHPEGLVMSTVAVVVGREQLMSAGRIEDPFYDRNEGKCAWMEGREWWYCLSFDGPAEPLQRDERLLLVFRGLNTFATIWLNGEELGRHRNIVREAVFDVSGRVRAVESNTRLPGSRPPYRKADASRGRDAKRRSDTVWRDRPRCRRRGSLRQAASPQGGFHRCLPRE